MTHITKPSDLALVTRRARRTLDLIDRHGERTWQLTREWSGHLRAAGGNEPSSGGGVSDPTAAAALAPDELAGLHSRYRAALALAVEAFDELETAITTVVGDGKTARARRKQTANANDAMFCRSCARAGGREPTRREGGKWCRWCEDMTRALAAEWTWEPGTAPPLKLVERHLEGKRLTVKAVNDAMSNAGVRRRTVDELEQLEVQQ